MVVALGWAYVRYGGPSYMQAAFYGSAAAVIGIIAYSSYKLAKKTVGRDTLLWFVYLVGAIVPFLYGGVVNEFHWLDDRQFLDSVAVATITPGPVVITVGFIGHLVAGLPAAVVAALGTFLPCCLFTVIRAPHFSKYGKLSGVKAFVDGVTAAAVGTIAAAVVVLGTRSVVVVPTAVIAFVSLVALWRIRKLPDIHVVPMAPAIGPAPHPYSRP